MSFVSRSPRECLASSFVARMPGEQCRRVWAQSGPRTPSDDFCKRSVSVALCGVELRKVASASQATPRSVLLGSFEKTRRAARTGMYGRMSGRLARTFRKTTAMSSNLSAARLSAPPEERVAPQVRHRLRSVVTRVLSKAKINPAGIVSPKSGG